MVLTGTMAFPASVSAVELGSKTCQKLGQLDGGLTMAVIGLGALDENGQPVKVMANGSLPACCMLWNTCSKVSMAK